MGALQCFLAARAATCLPETGGRWGAAMFFSFDGIDGTGKSTQLARLVAHLRRQGREVVTCRDPGGTLLGERLREILLHKSEIPLGRRAEMFLYMASRAQLVDEVIRPAIEAGDIVVADRFLLANVVYQGYAGGLSVEQLWQVGDVAVGGLHPSVVFLLDMDVAAASQRINRAPDRMESQGMAFMERVRRGYLAEAARRPEIVVIDAGRDARTVHQEICDIVENHLQPAAAGRATSEGKA
jgi:dTMP kinase